MKYYLLSLTALIAFIDANLWYEAGKEPETRCYRLARHSARVECVTRWQGDIIKRSIWMDLTQLRDESHGRP